MSARDRILGRLAKKPAATGAAQAMEQYLRQHARGPAPAVVADVTARFCRRAADLGSDVVRVGAAPEVPAAVARYLDAHACGRRAVCWPQLSSLDWRAADIAVETRAATGTDRVGLTGTFAAVAETGTLMLLSGPDTPATVSLLPDTHIALVHAGQIVATMEDAWERMRARGAIPRAVNFVSGPSRTADVEQTVTLGAHGPRRVLIVLVED